MRRILAPLAGLLVLAGTACGQNAPDTDTGQVRWLDVPQGQLKTKVYGASRRSESPVLVVVIHGDAAGPRPRPSLQYAVARMIAEGFDTVELPDPYGQHLGPPLRYEDVVAVGLLRPGYTDKEGDRSDGVLGLRTGDNHTPEVTEAVATAVDTLKQDLNAKAVILIGHSGGATISANILALHPGTAEAALLVGCGCDMATIRARYYDRTGWEAWRLPTTSLDPMDTADKVPVEKKVRLVAGEKDEIVHVADIRRYADALAAKGVDVNMAVGPGFGHNTVFFTPLVFNALDELVRAY